MTFSRTFFILYGYIFAGKELLLVFKSLRCSFGLRQPFYVLMCFMPNLLRDSQNLLEGLATESTVIREILFVLQNFLEIGQCCWWIFSENRRLSCQPSHNHRHGCQSFSENLQDFILYVMFLRKLLTKNPLKLKNRWLRCQVFRFGLQLVKT